VSLFRHRHRLLSASGPQAQSYSPTTGAVGDTVTLSGSGFGATQGAGAVTISGRSGTIVSWSPNSITFKVPAQPGGYPDLFGGVVVITNAGRSSAGPGFFVTTFSPLALANQQAWLRADSLGLTDGAAVVTWTDLYGLGNSPTQATSAKRPVFKTSILNGRGVVRFASASAQWLTLPTYASPASLTQPTMIFAVAAQTGGAAARNLLDSALSTQRNSCDYRLAGQMSLFAGGTAVVGGTVVGASFHIYSLSFNGASSQFWLDGVSDGTGNPGAQAMQGLQIGQNAALAGTSLDGDVAEVIVVNSTPSTSLRRSCEAYLAAYYGLTVT
jgi:hypothetical protein